MCKIEMGVCRVCMTECVWIEYIDGELFTYRVCSPECLERIDNSDAKVDQTETG